MRGRIDYGLDAPGWLFSSFAVGAGLLVAGLLLRPAWHDLAWFSIPFLGYAAVHLWSSRCGKLREAKRMIDEIPWRGDERVLDAGCGRGLMLIEAARHLRNGYAIGVDVWSAKDQWHNQADKTRRNAQLAGVADHVEVQSADVRHLPFDDGSFDVVLSSFVLHNIANSAERGQAVRELARVLRPGGRLAILDIFNTRSYEAELRSAGLQDVRRSDLRPLFMMDTRWVTATKK